MGAGDHGTSVRGESAAGGTQGDGQEPVCGESGGSFWKAALGCVFSCEYGCGVADRHGYVPGRRGDVPAGAGVCGGEGRRFYGAG